MRREAKIENGGVQGLSGQDGANVTDGIRGLQG